MFFLLFFLLSLPKICGGVTQAFYNFHIKPFSAFRFFRFWCFWCFGVPLITLLMFLCPACSHLLGWGFVKLLRLIFQSILRAKGWLMDFWFRFFGRKGASADWSVDAAVFFFPEGMIPFFSRCYMFGLIRFQVFLYSSRLQ